MFLWNTGLCSGDALCSAPANGRAVSKKQNKMNQPTNQTNKQETTKQKADFFKASYLGAYFTAARIARSLA